MEVMHTNGSKSRLIVHFENILVKRESIQNFLKTSSKGLILDVRSPMEFHSGHIPGAISFPLFSDEERAIVGTLYKQKGKTEAVLKGLEIVGPKLKGMVENAMALKGKTLCIHCWRGGMRSESVSHLLQTSGLSCIVLNGGYKAYRSFILSQFAKSWKLKVLGGKTGSGKTKILNQLKEKGHQIIDLENLANHKGSAFGNIGELNQPTTEQFGNNLFKVLQSFDSKKPIWIEDESQTIGSVFIPTEFYANYRKSPLYVLEIPLEQRINNLVDLYGKFRIEDLKESFYRIKRKLGGQNLNEALEWLDKNNMKKAAAIALKYYDQSYEYGLKHKDTNEILFLSEHEFLKVSHAQN